jgi:general secretion pathway protein B
MSFILDALKKSETDRQRQNGPALFEVRVAPPRNSLPLWAVGLAVLLAVNLVIVAWVLLRRPSGQDSSAETDAASHAASPQYAAAQSGNPQSAGPLQPMQGSQGPAGAQSQGFAPPAPYAAAPVSGTSPGGSVGQPAGMTQAAGMGQQGTTAPGATTTGYGQQSPNANGANGNGMSAANAPAGAPTDSGDGNPDDYAPATDPPAMPGFANRVSRSTSSGVPLYQDAAQTNHLPNLHLDLHVFAANPQQRFVMINTHKLHEGDALPEGVRVESITPEGAVLSHNGTRFLLPRE